MTQIRCCHYPLDKPTPIVNLGEFGSFRLSIRTDGTELEEDVSVRNIKKIGVRFVPGAAFRKAMEDVTFEKTE